MILQQAMFTSARTSRSDGYHLVCRSQGIDTALVRALTNWSPSHGSLRPGQDTAVSFFRLPNDDYCIARTTREEPEHSGRGERLQTHLLVVSPADFARADCNPIVIHELARACEQFRAAPPANVEFLDELELPWPRTRIEMELLQLACSADEMHYVPAVSETVCEQPMVGLVHVARPLYLMAGLFFWLPRESRGEVSFTTGLQYSPRRPFRLICLDDKPTEVRQHARRGMTLLDLADLQLRAETPDEGWHAVMSVATGG